ncbi:Dehydroquinate synthase-like protein [Trichoderma citrinoviride]|uniref:Dehydroquinate synthase-like protein n=1 Tax=Trichoderma citrinoviride TaxID=58853 RepID=A0A2T4AXU4_9HYPO|nr:Dehydroquinate synthase-like protein [Trichoderma citrinoviride]PTB61895.1 Dehydroquinate synthase-like protein [Trichoderma citrinoviride]
MASFEYNENTQRVLFGQDSLAKLPSELAKLGCSKPLILTTPTKTSYVDDIASLLDGRIAGSFTRVTMHTPTDVTEDALKHCKSVNADCLVSIGGGSAVGLGKALFVRTGLPHITVPTTYAGSEMTPIVGQTENRVKTTHVDRKAIPAVVIYDVNLTLTLPAKISATSGLNAMAHAVEALYAQDGNPIASMFAVKGIQTLATSLPRIMQNPQDVDARSDALLGAWFCGKCLAGVGVSLHHKLCHVLGGTFNLPHAETHAIILPHAVAYLAPSIPETMKVLAENIPDSEGNAVNGLNRLLSKLGITYSLGDLGLKEEDIDLAVTTLLKKPFWSPRPIEGDLIRELLRRAWEGKPAQIAE